MHVTDEVLNPALIRTQVALPEYGGIVTFEGVVREENLGRKVEYLEYEAYAPMAEAEMERIILEAKSRWGPISVAVHHRTGRLEVGELSIVVVVAAPHRAEAFRACEYIVDQVKERAPIWKREVWEGGAEWIGSPDGAEEEIASS
jgi:molybdopterin synthase catalytic subunit